MPNFTKTVTERHQNHIEANRKWRVNNPEKWLKINRDYTNQYRKDYPERIKTIKKKEYLKNRARYLERSRLWRLENPKKVKSNNEKFYERGKELRNKSKCERCEIVSEDRLCNWCKNDLKTMKLQGKRIVLKEVSENPTNPPKGSIIVMNSEKTIIKAKILATGHECDIKSNYALVNRHYTEDFEWKGEKCLITLEEHLIATE